MLLLTASAVVLWPRTYGASATIVIDGSPSLRNPVALAGRIEAALLSREELATIAMDLPPELRSPDPIGRLRAGIRVQSRGASGYSVEFRGSDPQSVQRIANHLADRAVKLVPKLASAPADNAPTLALAERSRAVTEFLTAHPEIALESSPGKPNATTDSGLDALRTEKRQIEQRLAAPGATDNPYAEPQQDPELLNRRLAELKNIIARRETAMKQPRPSAPSITPELTAQWRTLLEELATAQAATADGTAQKLPTVTGHVTARASLPTSPLTPNRLVLSIVAALLSVAAALVSYVLPRRSTSAKRQAPRSSPSATANDAAKKLAPRSSEEPANPSAPQQPAAPAIAAPASPLPSGSAPGSPSTAPAPSRSDPPPAGRPGSEPPGPIAIQRTVVLTGKSTSSVPPKRSATSPGGIAAPSSDRPPPLGNAGNAGNAAVPPAPGPHSPPAAPLFGSRPPPGAGSYSVSSSHPPPMGSAGGRRTVVEHLSPLPSAPPSATASNPGPTRRSPSPANTNPATQIVSRPPALDPDAETWAARFETLPPPAPEEAPRKRSGRWKTQVMGSMVPLEVLAAREERPPESEPVSVQVEQRHAGKTAEVVPPGSSLGPIKDVPLDLHDVPPGWSPKLDAPPAWINDLRDAVLKQLSARRMTIAVTGAAGQTRAQVAGSLALALAQSGAHVLLLEADFDRPELHQVMSISMPAGAGFSQQLRARQQQAGAPQPWRLLSCSANLQVLVEGRLRSPGLSTSRALENALGELKDRYHVLLLHAAPLERAAEVRPLTDVIQAVVVARGQEPATLQIGARVLDSLL